MINVWSFAEDLPFVEVADINGVIFRGEIIHISDAEEADAEDDEVVVEALSGEIRIFPVSQISSMKRTNKNLL